MMVLYRSLTFAAAPFLPYWLARREKKGKEDPARRGERLGHASLARPQGPLLWVHAASVGESTSVLTLIDALRVRYARLHILITTGTVTSARLMQQRLPAGVLHQFAPIDTQAAVRRFLTHWKPDAALWVESELWPNLVQQTHRSGCYMALLNARMSERSFHAWQKFPSLARSMLACFEHCFAQTEADRERFKALGAGNAACVGNLKYDADPLPANGAALSDLQTAVSARPCWLAASTHEGEEAAIAETHRLLQPALPHLLTMIAPRHPERGSAVAALLESSGARVAQRSLNEPITAKTSFYLADTLGELGLFYRLCPVAFIGGSLVPVGGHNPLEALRLGCVPVLGPHMQNFQDVANELIASGACLRAADSAMLARGVLALLQEESERAALAACGRRWLAGKQGATERAVNMLAPSLDRLFLRDTAS